MGEEQTNAMSHAHDILIGKRGKKNENQKLNKRELLKLSSMQFKSSDAIWERRQEGENTSRIFNRSGHTQDDDTNISIFSIFSGFLSLKNNQQSNKLYRYFYRR